jgi:mitofilin
VGFSAVGVGVAYAMGVIPSDVLSVVPGFKKDDNVKKDEETNAQGEIRHEMQSLSKQVEKPSTKGVTGNRVVNIHVPSAHGRTSEPVLIQKHADDGNRVTVKKFFQVYGGGDDSMSVHKVEPHATSLEFETIDAMKTQEPAKDITTAMIKEAQKELRSSSVHNNNIDNELSQAHTLLTTALDEKFMKELEGLTIHDLKMRIVQLASEMNDRTRWEAVRLREFLAMKEKEIGEK